mmetsp:Transcript_45281/g.94985  ORF Transcript_45281/g.94985 Transcript_45281/m.94985 type:complete len:218 (-) Transcript_45281:1294-1947(-)
MNIFLLSLFAQRNAPQSSSILPRLDPDRLVGPVQASGLVLLHTQGNLTLIPLGSKLFPLVCELPSFCGTFLCRVQGVFDPRQSLGQRVQCISLRVHFLCLGDASQWIRFVIVRGRFKVVIIMYRIHGLTRRSFGHIVLNPLSSPLHCQLSRLGLLNPRLLSHHGTYLRSIPANFAFFLLFLIASLFLLFAPLQCLLHLSPHFLSIFLLLPFPFFIII